MTGPEHYREAERLLGMATDNDGDIVTDDGMTANTLAAAQAHATLALAASAALGNTHTGAMPAADYEAWRGAAGTKVAAS